MLVLLWLDRLSGKLIHNLIPATEQSMRCAHDLFDRPYRLPNCFKFERPVSGGATLN